MTLRSYLFRIPPLLRPAISLLVLLAMPHLIQAAELKTRNVFLLTTDGLRQEEVFQGAEEILLSKEFGNISNTNALRAEFWRPEATARREVLFPFLWGTVARQGQIWGNRARGSEVRVTNGRNFSYPGYNEFLTGFADPAIDSNDKVLNANTNVFEWLNAQPGFQGRVVAVINWDTLPWILNAPRAGFPVWSGFATPDGTRALPVPAALTEMVEHGRTVWSGVLLDTFVGYAAKYAVKTFKPRALYVSFGETDDWAHEGSYERYLRAAHEFDRFVGDLWTLVQSMPEYRDQTTFVITVDHGRGPAPVAWKNHGREMVDSAYMWLAVIGPDTPALGERTGVPLVRQAQVAATVAALVGQDFAKASPKSAPALEAVITRP
ncbi:MAG TPA: AP protein [Verrucomicrobiota bacterium]|nr:AP protein [Verrucomicrobiales bacterium]HRI16535.1 AP protein [Verrucomicrobiota bacterium]